MARNAASLDRSPDHLHVMSLKLNCHGRLQGWAQGGLLYPQHPLTPTCADPPLTLILVPPPTTTLDPELWRGLWWVLDTEEISTLLRRGQQNLAKSLQFNRKMSQTTNSRKKQRCYPTAGQWRPRALCPWSAQL